MIGSVLRAGNDVMPFEDVGVRRVRFDIRRRVLCNRLVLASEALMCCLAGHDIVVDLCGKLWSVVRLEDGLSVQEGKASQR